MTTAPDRAVRIAEVLESVTLLSSGITASRYVPFHGTTLTRTQLAALHRLAHARTPLSPSRLASALGVTRGAVTQLLEGLQVAQLVQLTANPGDARSRIVTLTVEAAAEVAAFEEGVVAGVQPLFADLGDDELDQLGRLLARVREFA